MGQRPVHASVGGLPSLLALLDKSEMTEDGLISVLTSVVDRGLCRVPILGQARAVMEDRLDGLSMRLESGKTD